MMDDNKDKAIQINANDDLGTKDVELYQADVYKNAAQMSMREVESIT